MDPKLAAIYGTNQSDADLEKLAAAELAEGLANDDAVDTDGLTEEELEAVAQDVLNASAEGEEEGGNIDGEQEKTSAAEAAQEKLAEADYLGRVMAHSYNQELQKIASDVGMYGGTPPSAAQRMKKSLKETGGKLKAKATELGGKAKAHAMKASDSIESRADKMIAGGAAGAKKGLDFAKKHKGKAALGALAIGGGLAARKAMKKQSSALDTLVEQRAMEILQASGIDPAELEQVEGQEKVSDPREALASAVDERAWALLGQYGVVPSEE